MDDSRASSAECGSAAGHCQDLTAEAWAPFTAEDRVASESLDVGVLPQHGDDAATELARRHSEPEVQLLAGCVACTAPPCLLPDGMHVSCTTPCMLLGL